MLASKVNVCASGETEILNNVSERSLPRSIDQTFTFAEMSQVFRCHEPLRVALGSDPSPEPELSQDPTMHLRVCRELP